MPTSAPPSNRFARRRAETRQALVRAARQILAESGDTSVSIQAIADRADVGFGSFYNHFESKTALFDAAVADALDEYGQAIDEAVQEIDDPAELVAAGVRLSAKMAGSHPEIMQILRHRGLGQILPPARDSVRAGEAPSDRGLAPRALRDLERGVASGRFAPLEPTVALSAMGGALLALLELRFARPDIDGDEAGANLAEMVLRMLGVPPDDAHEVARRALPEPT